MKRAKDGRIFHYRGMDEAGRKIKFSLGFDQPSAQVKADLIDALWSRNCSYEPVLQGDSYNNGVATRVEKVNYWRSEFLAEAKAIAKGNPPVLPAGPRGRAEPQQYLRDIRNIQDVTQTAWRPEDEVLAEIARNDAVETISHLRRNLSGSSHIEAVGITLSEVLKRFEDAIRQQYIQPDGSMNTTGKSLLDEIGGVTRFLSQAFTIEKGEMVPQDLLGKDLAQLDTLTCQEVFDAIRRRPVSEKKNGERIAPRYARNLVKLLGRFFEWLDGVDLGWSEPPKFRRIKKTIDPLTPEEKFRQSLKKEQSVIPINHLAVISQYCRDNERLLLLLGLNCAFGEGEAGNLRIPFIKQNEIRGIRFKTGNETRHLLWQETMDAIQQAIKARPQMEYDREQILIVSTSGKPLYNRTALSVIRLA